ncbi:MAG TPA: glycosyltransferase, partial [Candidatus Acidoferrum sp.]|nr:glycosyltransferase [Candidatus Acidoferrum sp.]
MQSGKVLMLYLEPTPYLLGLIACLRQRWSAGLDVVFAGTNLSQRWELPLERDGLELLPHDRRQLWRRLRELIGSRRHCVIHLAGWGGHPALTMALLLAWWHGIAVTVESDTPLPPRLAWWKRGIKRLAYPLLFRLPALFMPGGTRQAAMLAHYGVPAARISIVGMTVDVTAISAHVRAIDPQQRTAIRERLGIVAGDVVLLYVGRMEPHKGIADLLEAFRGLGQPQARLLLVGEGSLS